VLTIAAAIYWLTGKSVNVYRSPVVSAVFELLWFPALIILFILPIVSLVYWVKEKFNSRSLNFYSLIIAVITILAIAILK
jgi:phosphoglycerol transferase MdoB-like AlkP superfamily enzyme